MPHLIQTQPRQVVTCPACGFAATGSEFNSGWIVRTSLGTYIGNYGDEKPPAHLRSHVEPFTEMDKTVLIPCRHEVRPSDLVREPDPEADHRAYPTELPTSFPIDFETTCGTCERKIRLLEVGSDGFKFTHYGYGS